MRAMISDAEGDLAQSRPDILGITMAWHGDGGGFTQLVYFTTEASARSGERDDAGSDLDQQYQAMMAGEPTFIDLTDPHFD
jgi:hypothetical protein